MLNRRSFLQNSITAALGVFLSSFKKYLLFDRDAGYNVIMGRPTANAVTLSILPQRPMEMYIEYGSSENKMNGKTSQIRLTAGEPHEFLLDGLEKDRRHYYRISTRENSDPEFKKGITRSFHTQRKKGSSFVFAIIADSHLGTAKHCDPALYQLTLDNLQQDQPDLLFSMGDDFRASKVNNPDYGKIETLYHNQRMHLGTLCHSIPYFFILGNHELEAKAFSDGTENCLASWSEKARKKFIPNPVPDTFYTGNKETGNQDGQRQNYYAFEWGDVLFITLDVFWYSNISAADEEMRELSKTKEEGMSREERLKAKEERMKAREENKGNKKEGGQDKKRDQWNFTIGKAQYDWLKDTLEKSHSKFRFVMGHHVMGSCRGGVEWAPTFEWGGANRKGMDQFATNRPGWEMPIHQLFVKHKVNAFIQGHDHLFARQELDGIAYITCPMSGDPGYNAYNSESYLSGDKLNNTGHLKMTVSKEDVEMHYIRAVLPGDEAVQGKNGSVAYKWSFNKKEKLS